MTEKEGGVRSFLALEISSHTRQSISIQIAPLKEKYPQFRFIPQENWHLTLHFFGELSWANIDLLRTELRGLFQKTQPFQIPFDQIGCFKSILHPRILWVGSAASVSSLLKLKNDLDSKLNALGFETEDRQFKPHLTIAKLKPNKRPPKLEKKDLIWPHACWLIEGVRSAILYKSTLSTQGACYEVLQQFRFG